MKTISRLFGAAAAIAALAACNKEASYKESLPKSFKKMTLTVKSGATKVHMIDDESGNLYWDDTDELAVIFSGNPHAYKFVKSNDNTFQNAEEIPDYKFDNITDVYYPYFDGVAVKYKNYCVTPNQNCIKPNDVGGYDKFERLPMHWNRDKYGASENAITMYADRTAMIRVSKDDFTHQGPYVTVDMYDTFGKSGKPMTYHIYNVGDDDLIFFVDLYDGQKDGFDKTFKINGTIMHTSYDGGPGKPIDVHASTLSRPYNRFVLHPYLFVGFDFVGYYKFNLDKETQNTSWNDAIEDRIIPEELGLTIVDGRIYCEDIDAYLFYEDGETPVESSDPLSMADSQLLTLG